MPALVLDNVDGMFVYCADYCVPRWAERERDVEWKHFRSGVENLLCKSKPTTTKQAWRIKLSEVIEHVPRLNQHKARSQHHGRLSARTTSINKIKLERTTWLTWQMDASGLNEHEEKFEPSDSEDSQTHWPGGNKFDEFPLSQFSASWCLVASIIFTVHCHPFLVRCHNRCRFLERAARSAGFGRFPSFCRFASRQRRDRSGEPTQSDRERHEMFIYCFYRHVKHLNGSYVIKISREPQKKTRWKGRCRRVCENWFRSQREKMPGGDWEPFWTFNDMWLHVNLSLSIQMGTRVLH